MSGVLEKTFGGIVNSIFGNSQGLSSKNAISPPLAGLRNVSFGLIHFVEKLTAARKISRQVRILEPNILFVNYH